MKTIRKLCLATALVAVTGSAAPARAAITTNALTANALTHNGLHVSGLAPAATLGTAGQAHAAPAPGTPKFEVLHAFKGPDGRGPYTPKLAIDPQGVVYGSTSSGSGARQRGTVWGLAPPIGRGAGWTFSTLH